MIDGKQQESVDLFEGLRTSQLGTLVGLHHLLEVGTAPDFKNTTRYFIVSSYWPRSGISLLLRHVSLVQHLFVNNLQSAAGVELVHFSISSYWPRSGISLLLRHV